MSKHDRNQLAKKHMERQRQAEAREWQREQHRRQHPGLYED